jgi:purine-binding chemotaxis protein CheW
MTTATAAAIPAAKRSISEDISTLTVVANGEVFGLPIQTVQTIFRISSLAPVPMGPPDVAGLVNLRGKIVTAVSLRRRLKMENDLVETNALAIGIEHKGEYFCLVVDRVGEVLALDESKKIPIPPHFDPERLRLTTEFYRIGSMLIPVLDVGALFDFAK